MEQLRKIPNYFSRPFPHWNRIETFRQVLYWFLLINTITLLPIAVELWDYNGLIGTRGWYSNEPWYNHTGYALLNVLSHPYAAGWTWLWKAFVFFQLLFLVTGILRIMPVISSLGVYFFTVNLFHKGYLAFTGGEVLVNILLFYMIFIQTTEQQDGIKGIFRRRKVVTPEFSWMQNLLNNSFFLIMLIQVCVLYFFSCLWKLYDPNWTSGNALMYISNIDAFSSGGMRALFGENETLSAIGTYASLIYMGLFPALVWFKKVKIPLLIFGVLFHLGISFGMGVFSFGIIMCISYLLFLDSEQIDWLKKKLRFRKAKSS